MIEKPHVFLEKYVSILKKGGELKNLKTKVPNNIHKFFKEVKS